MINFHAQIYFILLLFLNEYYSKMNWNKRMRCDLIVIAIIHLNYYKSWDLEQMNVVRLVEIQRLDMVHSILAVICLHQLVHKSAHLGMKGGEMEKWRENDKFKCLSQPEITRKFDFRFLQIRLFFNLIPTFLKRNIFHKNCSRFAPPHHSSPPPSPLHCCCASKPHNDVLTSATMSRALSVVSVWREDWRGSFAVLAIKINIIARKVCRPQLIFHNPSTHVHLVAPAAKKTIKLMALMH